MINDDDFALVESCRRGDRAAFTVLATRYTRPIYNAAYRVLGNEQDANDVTQAVFLRVLERLDEYDPQYRFFSWIYRISINEAIDLVRSRRREEPIGDEEAFPAGDGADPEVQFSDRERSELVQAAMMKLNVEDRVVLTLRHFSELSYSEIAKILNLEEKTVKSRIFEARRRLAGLLITKDLRTT